VTLPRQFVSIRTSLSQDRSANNTGVVQQSVADLGTLVHTTCQPFTAVSHRVRSRHLKKQTAAGLTKVLYNRPRDNRRRTCPETKALPWTQGAFRNVLENRSTCDCQLPANQGISATSLLHDVHW
jgi:hypothetical protein